MVGNNLPNDMYNPPSVSQTDFEEIRFNEIDSDDLFWLNQNPNGDVNHVHRKISDGEAMNLKTGVTSTFKNIYVYQKI
tara:strand:- start:97 stop:330 length:234 start_codon:yes stop_codon:yes gene_type:complete